MPDPQDPETFLRSKLDWSEPEDGPHRDLLDWYRQLISFRRRQPDLGTGDRKHVATAFNEGARWLVVRRGRFSIAANFADEAQAVPLECSGAVVLSSSAEVTLAGCRGASSGSLGQTGPGTFARPFGSGRRALRPADVRRLAGSNRRLGREGATPGRRC